MPRVVLVSSSEHLPGLFPFQAWEVLRGAALVWTRDPDAHPSAAYLRLAEVALVALEPAPLDLAGLDLSRPGSVEERRLASALVDLAEVEDVAVYLLGPEDSDDLIRSVGLEAADAGCEVEFVFHHEPPGTQVLRLAAVERVLRDPDDGCPWDLEQDHRSLSRHAVEETYELLEAIESGEDAAIAEELGDVLLQVVFHAQIASDRGAFDLDDVARGIADKLVHRHPHVFADVEVEDADAVKANWEVLKHEEKRRSGPFEGVPSALPALQLAQALGGRAARLGHEHADPAGRVERVLGSLTSAGVRDEGADEGAEEDALGELLLAAVDLARDLDVDAETALRRAARRLRDRFEDDAR